ncbi:16S rRNA (guanine(527)-N(7))-methyltransferase RsmG [Enterocloster asparagiformis]|uniref:16S rRNA (guanine(527)-N(7))-methyltransferase RsmG n=1 Tax=Enterocloster asparagiformis TaxID=333367 RepID=UPI0004672D66|nr:16S rRNA (guanine(527)-N(7))-methyltransferase RsmG [Enterocloster asparagiformis]
MTDRFADQMKREAGELEIALNGGQLEQFFRYYELLVERNKVMNLTAITEEQDVVTKHFTDSLSLVKLMGAEALAGKTLMDVGTGAGFPGIPLKIAFPELNVTLLDSLNKRVRFLMDVCEELGLKDITAVHGRAEDFGRNLQYREQFDLCVSRAVANLASLSEYCMPFVKVGGYFVPYKSGEIEEELEAGKRAVKILGGEVEGVEKFTLPGADASRSLIRIRKIKGISGKYPRKAGLPTKEPLY